MKLQFEANLDYQLEAISAVVDIFEGNDTVNIESAIIVSDSRQQTIESVSAISNTLALDETQLARNIQEIQLKNNLPPSKITDEAGSELLQLDVSALDGSAMLTGSTENIQVENGMNFSVEMETGTGKTYVYLRTIHELRQKYGWRKFIIVVPSVAIREGVLKNLKITREHFASLYNRPEMDYYVWDAKKRGQARQFATTDTLQIMVITIDSFAKAENIMNKAGDYGTPLHYIRATNPIIIVDEPQNMETEKRKAAIESLNPLFTLRYSATHKNLYNLMYRLNPVDAYDRGLVKKIEVDSILSDESGNDARVNLIKFSWKNKSTPTAQIEINVDTRSGLQQKVLNLESGSDLFELSGRRSVYEGYVLDQINISDGYIEFTNGKTFYVGQKNDDLAEKIMRYQIERTIENHFEKELKLARQGIKVLSLFFIDKVANYREYDDDGFKKGKFAQWFEESYEKIRQKPKFVNALQGFSANQVHDGYFAEDKKGKWKDSRDSEDGAKTIDDNSAYELIMKDKERLLSLNEPLRFIFSHSALREGWDNPNVFNICTLNETSSEMKKRQEIGRGLRLPVNNKGERVRDESINILTVIANESYEDFARKLQYEIESEAGVDFGGRIKNKAKRKPVHLKKRLELDADFMELWDKIKYRTRYRVEYNEKTLIDNTVKLLDGFLTPKPKITSTRTRITKMSDGLTGEVKSTNGTYVREMRVIVPDILSKISDNSKVTRKVVFEVLDKSGMFEQIPINPQAVVDEVSEKISTALSHLIIDNIKYEKTGDVWDMRLFENEELEKYIDEKWQQEGRFAKTIYNYVETDSEIERRFVRDMEARDDVRAYIKLPNWFKIDTPLGKYNPDWAVIFDGDERLYFVAETKGTNNINELRPDEQGKIRSGRKHFEELDVQFIAPADSLSNAIKNYEYGR